LLAFKLEFGLPHMSAGRFLHLTAGGYVKRKNNDQENKIQPPCHDDRGTRPGIRCIRSNTVAAGPGTVTMTVTAVGKKNISRSLFQNKLDVVFGNEWRTDVFLADSSYRHGTVPGPAATVFAAKTPDTRTSATIIMARRLDLLFLIIVFPFYVSSCC